jgi:hypothetical protein
MAIARVLYSAVLPQPEPPVNLDWHKLKAVVLESDDWGLCAWCPDEQAARVLADTPVFRSEAGRIYGRSTLESADDVRRLTGVLLEFRGGDGFPPVWQANTVMAAPDYARLQSPTLPPDGMPVLAIPDAPSRWRRPGLWDQVRASIESGVWWPELHGLTHVPERAWLGALERGAADARRALEQQSPLCEAVQASGEYDASEPLDVRRRGLERALAIFARTFGRAPGSFCPPDYRWDELFEAVAESLGVTTWQGRAERSGGLLPVAGRLVRRMLGSESRGQRYYLPARIAFEPRGRSAPGDRLGAASTLRAVRGAWGRGQPAIVSTHRHNYAHLDPAWAEAGRAALRELLAALCGDGATFLTDAEVRALEERAFSVRPIGARGALLRFCGVPGETFRFPAPAGVTGAGVREGRAGDVQHLVVDRGEVEARVNVGEYLIEWRTA